MSQELLTWSDFTNQFSVSMIKIVVKKEMWTLIFIMNTAFCIRELSIYQLYTNLLIPKCRNSKETIEGIGEERNM